MAYNNNFPIGYQPAQFYYAQPQAQGQQQKSNRIIWVQGEAGAKSYLVAPNTSVVLFDSERQSVYIKSADNSCMPSMKILDYTIRDNPQATQVVNNVNWATKDDVKSLNDQIAALKSELEGLTKRTPRRKEDNE